MNKIANREVCTGCGEAFKENQAAFCEACAGDDYGDSHEWPSESAERDIRAWADRQRLLHGLAPEIVAVLEQCATDIAEGFHG